MNQRHHSHALSAAALRSPKKRAGGLVRQPGPANKSRATRSSLTLHKWRDKIEFQKLDIPNPEPLPIGPTTVIGDNVGFSRAT